MFKKVLFLVIGSVLALNSVNAQLIPITEKQKLKKEYKKNREVQLEEGWDIVPFPGEQPEKVSKRDALDPNAITNWGKDLLLPADVKARLQAECKNKVVIKIFDTAGKSSHTYLQQGQLLGSNFATGGLEDVNGHGTHVAGIIAGNEVGLLDALVDAGIVTWKPVKVLSDAGSGSFAWIATAIQTENTDNKNLLSKGTFVICNASLGGGTAKVSSVESALKLDADAGVIWCVATGNTGTQGVNYPGNSQYVIGTGSLDNTNPLKHSSYTSYGPELWMGAPGRGINSTYLNNSFASLSGTSMATPFQTALCAIAKSKWGTGIKDLAHMKAYLAWIATDLGAKGKDDYTGYGVAFVKAILDKNPKDMNNENPDDPEDPQDPNPPTPPAHPVRTLSFSLDGNWSMVWNNDLGLSSEPKTVRYSNKDFKTLALEKLTITHIEVEIPNTTKYSTQEYADLLNNTNVFFTNRGLQLVGNSDYADAAYWAAYFYEMLLERQSPVLQSVNVIRIDAKDKNGKSVVWFSKELKHWPPQ